MKSTFVEAKKIGKEFAKRDNSMDFDAPPEIQGFWEKKIKQYQFSTKIDLLASLQLGFTSTEDIGAKKIDPIGDVPASFLDDAEEPAHEQREDSVRKKFSDVTYPHDYMQPPDGD
jgi:hypothetical protein